jgi:hypothetical protein
VSRLNEGVSFTAQSVSQFAGNSWIFTPVQREFQIDFRTIFLNEYGIVPQQEFMGFMGGDVLNRAYNVITDGARATHVVAAPFADRALRGTIHSIEGDRVILRDAFVHDAATNRWTPISAANNHMVLYLQPNTIIAKNNEIVFPRALVAGERLLIMTDHIPAPRSGMEVTGYIVFVES